MKNNKGFTLIEMIVVIVILGILAVTAAPKFLNFSSDARIAVLEGYIGAFQSADSIVMAKARAIGLEDKMEAQEIPGTGIKVESGHMSLLPESLENSMDMEDYSLYVPRYGAPLINVHLDNPSGEPNPKPTKNCYVEIRRNTISSNQNGVTTNSMSEFIINRVYTEC